VLRKRLIAVRLAFRDRICPRRKGYDDTGAYFQTSSRSREERNSNGHRVAAILSFRTYSRIYLIQELRAADLIVFRRNTRSICRAAETIVPECTNAAARYLSFATDDNWLPLVTNARGIRAWFSSRGNGWKNSDVTGPSAVSQACSPMSVDPRNIWQLAFTSQVPFYPLLRFSPHAPRIPPSPIPRGPTSTTTLDDGVPSKFPSTRGRVEKSMARKAGEQRCKAHLCCRPARKTLKNAVMTHCPRIARDNYTPLRPTRYSLFFRSRPPTEARCGRSRYAKACTSTRRFIVDYSVSIFYNPRAKETHVCRDRDIAAATSLLHFPN